MLKIPKLSGDEIWRNKTEKIVFHTIKTILISLGRRVVYPFLWLLGRPTSQGLGGASIDKQTTGKNVRPFLNTRC
jgi:hypothetical protein